MARAMPNNEARISHRRVCTLELLLSLDHEGRDLGHQPRILAQVEFFSNSCIHPSNCLCHTRRALAFDICRRDAPSSPHCSGLFIVMRQIQFQIVLIRASLNLLIRPARPNKLRG